MNCQSPSGRFYNPIVLVYNITYNDLLNLINHNIQFIMEIMKYYERYGIY